ncbi:Protein TSS [Bienertia sinuspersici]
MAVSPIRRSPHQSATARVPYGPRLSGGYNRSGNKGNRIKPGIHNGEHMGDVNHFNPPIIMNPHATEFVPVQPWLPNGYPVSPNGYMGPPNGMPVSPNGYATMPTNVGAAPNNDYQPSLKGIPEAQNGSPSSPNDSSDSLDAAPAETAPENHDQTVVNEESSANPSLETATATDKQEETEEEKHEDVNGKTESEECIVAEPALSDSVNVVNEESDDHPMVKEKSSKCWGDYCENEVVEVTH